MEQLAQEGAIQIFRELGAGMESVIVGAVGVLQFEVLEQRLKNEYNVEVRRQGLPYSIIRWVANPEEVDVPKLNLTHDTYRVENMRGEDFRCEHRNGGELHLVLCSAYRVAESEDARIEQAHDIACVGFIDNGAVVSHERSAGSELQLFLPLHMVGFHASLELARADAHESNAVTMVLVHVRLDFEHEAREGFRHRIYQRIGKAVVVGARCGCQFQESFQEGFYAEVGKGRTEEYRRKLAVAYGFQVEFIACAVEKLDIVYQVAVVVFADKVVKKKSPQGALLPSSPILTLAKQPSRKSCSYTPAASKPPVLLRGKAAPSTPFPTGWISKRNAVFP